MIVLKKKKKLMKSLLGGSGDGDADGHFYECRITSQTESFCKAKNVREMLGDKMYLRPIMLYHAPMLFIECFMFLSAVQNYPLNVYSGPIDSFFVAVM